ncbi:hypothetical protein Tco_0966996 [Tanacetum coccineum]
MNKITSSCEICIGPHDTQYSMENPEQSFIDYASSSTDKAGGALPSDMVKNSKMNVNSTFPVLSTRSCPTEDQQCSTQIYCSINTITICPKQPNKSHVDKTKEERSSGNDEEKEVKWIDAEEPLDLIDTSEESVYESLIKEMPRCSLNYDFRIRKGDPRNLKIPCMIGHKEVAFKTPYKDLERNELTSQGHDLLSSRIILSEDDYDRGCRRPSDLENGFYNGTLELGPEYQTGLKKDNKSEMNDEGKVIFDEKKLGSS